MTPYTGMLDIDQEMVDNSGIGPELVAIVVSDMRRHAARHGVDENDPRWRFARWHAEPFTTSSLYVEPRAMVRVWLKLPALIAT